VSIIGPVPVTPADGDVDGSDFLIWQLGYGIATGATFFDGDANYDGAVNGDDLALWKSLFGSTLPGQALSRPVPEPGTCLLAAMALGCALLRQRKSLTYRRDNREDPPPSGLSGGR
jgi:PEP-CTERM motif